MPHLRFTRDKRGYETTALLTSGGGRRRGRQQRVLYFFRTPPGVRVGRAPIDEDAIRLLEQHNPGVEFDWTRILKSPLHGPEPARREDRRDRGQDPSRPPHAQPVAVPPRAAAEHAERAAEPEPIEPLEAGSPELEAESRELEAESRELEAGSPEPEALSVDPLPARYARLGAEGLARLRARYAEVLTRIAEKPLDEPVREELKTKAERLNPDAWVTDDEVAAALEQYEAVFEELRAVVGRPPRRRRRGRV